MSLLTKWIKSKNIEEVEQETNNFGKQHTVRATQTHVTCVKQGESQELMYTSVIFYEPTNNDQQKITNLLKK